jgi:hypothetical protein
LNRKEKFVAFRDEPEIIDRVSSDKGIDRSDFREAIGRRLRRRHCVV